MGQRVSSNKYPTTTSDMTSTTAINATPETDAQLANLQEEELKPVLPAGIPTEPRAMTIAKAKQRSPNKDMQAPIEATRRPSTSSFPPKAAHTTCTLAKLEKSSSASNPTARLLTLPSRKRRSDGLFSSPDAKRHAKERTPTVHDHCSPRSFRRSSSVRSSGRRECAVPVLIPAVYSTKKSHEKPASSTSTNIATAISGRKGPGTHTDVVAATTGEEECVKTKHICYNCGKKGHYFMDCLVGCGRCEGDGHRTIDCDVVKDHGPLNKDGKMV